MSRQHPYSKEGHKNEVGRESLKMVPGEETSVPTFQMV